MDLNKYRDFVNSKLSKQSTDFDTMMAELCGLYDQGMKIGVRVPELITAAEGLAAEGGEFIEIVKKMQWQGKPLNEENKYHMKRELGDAMFYLMVGCIALGYDPEEVILENMAKLDARYKDGFTVAESENREEGDL